MTKNNTDNHAGGAGNEIILVDIFDNCLGHAAKEEAHKQPTLHRAFSVFLHNDGKMLLQQRALGKYHTGGLWTNACCSHPRKGEDTQAAALRRLAEELGIAGAIGELRELTAFTYFYRFADDLYEYEYDHILLAPYAGVCRPNPAEVAETRWVSCGELAQEMQQYPQNFTPWFLIAAPMVLRWLENHYRLG